MTHFVAPEGPAIMDAGFMRAFAAAKTAAGASRLAESKPLYLAALAAANRTGGKSELEYVDCTLRLSDCCAAMYLLPEALRHNRAAAKILRSFNYGSVRVVYLFSDCENSAGSIYQRMGRGNDAIDAFERAITHGEHARMVVIGRAGVNLADTSAAVIVSLVTPLMNISQSYAKTGQPKKGLWALDRAVALFGPDVCKSIPDAVMSGVYAHKGDIFTVMDRPEEALPCFQRAEELCKKLHGGLSLEYAGATQNLGAGLIAGT